jgi:hypothetical protein
MYYPIRQQRHLEAFNDFSAKLTLAMASLKSQLQARYETVYPERADLIRFVISRAEGLARELSQFPHLLLPDLVEAYLGEMELQPAPVKSAPDYAQAA